MQIVLNEEEQQTLVEVINEVLPNLREEVYKTENFEYREQLKHRERVLKGLQERLAVRV